MHYHAMLLCYRHAPTVLKSRVNLEHGWLGLDLPKAKQSSS
jgi:hypothetical protein